MKKLFALLVLTLICQMAFCQTYDDMIKQFKDKDGAEFTEIPKALLSVAMSGADSQTKDIFKNVEGMKMLEVSKCSPAVKKDFLDQAGKLEAKYTKFIETEDDGEFNLILFEGDEEQASAIIVVTSDAKESEMMVIEGKLSLSQLEKIFDTMDDDE